MYVFRLKSTEERTTHCDVYYAKETNFRNIFSPFFSRKTNTQLFYICLCLYILEQWKGRDFSLLCIFMCLFICDNVRHYGLPIFFTPFILTNIFFFLFCYSNNKKTWKIKLFWHCSFFFSVISGKQCGKMRC